MILDWPDEANDDPPPPPPDDDDNDSEEDEEEKKKREKEAEKHGFNPKGHKRGTNFLTLTGGEYSGVSFVRFRDGWGMKKFSVERTGRTQFKANVETTHHYPKSKTRDIVRLLPNDITIVDAGQGRAYGRSQVRWLKKNGSIEVGDMQIDFSFKNKKARLPSTQVFSYEYGRGDTSRVPFTLKVRGTVRAVDSDNSSLKK